MNYKETVEKVMALLKEKEVCASIRKSHKDRYEALGDFMGNEDTLYSPEVRERWLDLIRNEIPR